MNLEIIKKNLENENKKYINAIDKALYYKYTFINSTGETVEKEGNHLDSINYHNSIYEKRLNKLLSDQFNWLKRNRKLPKELINMNTFVNSECDNLIFSLLPKNIKDEFSIFSNEINEKIERIYKTKVKLVLRGESWLTVEELIDKKQLLIDEIISVNVVKTADTDIMNHLIENVQPIYIPKKKKKLSVDIFIDKIIETDNIVKSVKKFIPNFKDWYMMVDKNGNYIFPGLPTSFAGKDENGKAIYKMDCWENKNSIKSIQYLPCKTEQTPTLLGETNFKLKVLSKKDSKISKKIHNKLIKENYIKLLN